MTSLTNHYTDQVRLGQVRIDQAIFSQVRLGQASNVYVVFSGVCQRNLYHLVGSVQHLVSCVIRIPNLNGIISITQLVLCSTQYSLLQVYFGEYRSLYILMSTVFCMVQLMKLYDLVWESIPKPKGQGLNFTYKCTQLKSHLIKISATKASKCCLKTFHKPSKLLVCQGRKEMSQLEWHANLQL